MSAPRVPAPVLHACAVVAAYSVVFGWLFAAAPLEGSFIAQSDLFEYYLPIFLAPITFWSPFEFSGLPAFADPGDFSLYPPHFFFARVVGSWTGLIASAFVLGASFTYAYVYRLTRSVAAAAFAGLAYGLSEAMFERVPHLGTLHAFAWLPLILLSIEGLLTPYRRRWMAIGGLGLGCCILAGHPQPAIYTSYACLLYALVGGRAERQDRRYYISVLGMFVIGGALASVKLLPLVEASFLMARQVVNFGQFADHSNTPGQLLTVLFPTVLHEGREAPTYVGLITLVFALVGAAQARRNWRAAFWVSASLVALALGAGQATPIARIAYEIVPLYSKFRVGARHLFLFAFGASVLAGLALSALERGEVSRRAIRGATLMVLILMAGAAALLAAVPDAFQYEVRAPLPWSLPIWNAGVWVQFLVAAASAIAIGLVAPGRPLRASLAVLGIVLVADTLYSLPYPVTARGITPVTIPHESLAPNAHALDINRDLEPLHQRALATGGTGRDAVLPAAFARLWRIPIAGAYGPMLLERYSLLAMMGTSGSVRPSLLAAQDVALDLLAVRFIIVQPDEIAEPPTFERDGVRWAVPPLDIPVGRPDCGHTYARTVSVPLPPDINVASLALVTHLSCSEHVAEGTEAAVVTIRGPDGPATTVPLHAGHQTAETALSESSIQGRAKHGPGRVFDTRETAAGHTYATTLHLPAPMREAVLEITAPGTGGWLTLDRVTVFDEAGNAHPLSAPGIWLQDRQRWRVVRRVQTSRTTDRGSDSNVPGERQHLIIENMRALPRAWIVDRLVGLDDRDALEAVRRSQLPDGQAFDPTAVAIVDKRALPAVTSFGSGQRTAVIRRVDDDEVVVDVSTERGGILVLSDTWYPGWRAYVDGSPVALYRTNVSLRGVVLPPGQHTVAFELASTTLRAGAALSVLCAFVSVLLLVSRPTSESPLPVVSAP